MRATRRLLFALVALTPISVLLVAGPVSAHTGFESSSPIDGSTVGDAVDVVTIAFSGPAEPAGEGFVILDSSGVVRAPDVVRAGRNGKPGRWASIRR